MNCFSKDKTFEWNTREIRIAKSKCSNQILLLPGCFVLTFQSRQLILSQPFEDSEKKRKRRVNKIVPSLNKQFNDTAI